MLTFVLLVPIADVMTGSRLSLSAAFGYSPTGNSRLYGISNYSFGQVAAASCLLAAFIAARRPGRRGQALAIGLLVAVLVVIGVPVFGSDVGGIIAFTPTILVFSVLVTGYSLRWRTVLVGVLATAVAVTAFGLLDLARPPGERAHLGRLFERVGNEGLEPLISIVERKLLANLGVTTSSFWVAVIPVAVAFLIFLTRYPTRPMARLREQIPTLQAGVWASVVAAVLGSAVNDSGAIVGGVTLFVLVIALAWLALVTLPPMRRDGRPAGESADAGPAEGVDDGRVPATPSAGTGTDAGETRHAGGGGGGPVVTTTRRPGDDVPPEDRRLHGGGDGPPDGPAGGADAVPRSARLFVGVLFALLLVPGLIGFDAWPLTGWRLFSASRDADVTRWVIEASDADGDRRVVSLEDLPLRYRHAEWPMAELPGASDERRDDVCEALLEAVVRVQPGTEELTIARDHAHLVERDGRWRTEHDIDPFHTCGPPTGGDLVEGDG